MSIFDKIKSNAKKNAKSIADIFTYTPEEKARGKKKTKIEETTSKISDYFKPTEKVRARDIVREVPKASFDVGKEIAQGTARSLDFAGRKILGGIYKPLEKVTGVDFTSSLKDLEGKKSSTLENVLFGGNKKRKDSLKNLAQEEVGINAEKHPLLSAVIGGVLVGADLIPGGQGKAKGVIKGLKITADEISALAKTKGLKTILKTLVNGGVDSKTAEKIAGDIVKASKGSDVKKIIEGGVSRVTPKKTKAPKGEVLYHSSDDVFENGKPDFDAYFGTQDWKSDFPKEFGKNEYEIVLPSNKKVLDLNKESKESKDFMKKVVDDLFPNNTAFKERIDAWEKDTVDDFYDMWTGKNDILPVIREQGLDGAKFRDEFLLTKETIQDLDVPIKETVKTSKKGERRFTSRVRSMADELTELLDGQKDVRSTEELITKADDLLAKDPTEALAIARQGDTDLSVAIASRYIDETVKQAKALPAGGERLKLWDDVAKVANDVAEALTEHGRAIQSASILGRLTPEGMVRYVATTIKKHNRAVVESLEPGNRSFFDNFKRGKAMKKVEELNAEDAREIAEAMQEALEEKTPLEVAKAIRDVIKKKIAPRVPDSLYSKLITLWKAGLLTGLKTTGLNVASNISHAGTEIIKDVPASLVDRIVSLFTGKRTLALTTKGSRKGVKEGAQKGWEYFKTGFDERDIGSKLDYKNVNFGKNKFAKALQTYEETVFRSLGAQDQPAYYSAKIRSMYSQAIAQAKNKGLKGKEAKAFVEELISNPTDEILKYSILDAETAVFQNTTALGKGAKVIQNLPGGEIVLPFGKTPSAVATQIINYSPIGVASTIVKAIGKGKFDQRLFSQGIGRGMTGTAVLFIGMKLAQNGMATTSYPTSEKERELWELEGRQSNSIKINGKWRTPASLGPVGILLTVGAQLQEGIDNTGSFVGGLAQAVPGTAGVLTDQSFLRGLNQALQAITDPSRSWRGWASSVAGSIVPTLIADIARSADKYERRTSTPGERIKSRIPFLRETLEQKIDAFGQKVETPSLFTTLANPTRPVEPSADLNDPVLKEMQELRDDGYLVTPTQLGPNSGYKSLSPEENTKLWRIAGIASRNEILRLMEDPAWEKRDGEQKERLIKSSVQDITTEARARIVLEAVSDLEGKEKALRLREMVEDKLLTKSVYSIYLALDKK